MTAQDERADWGAGVKRHPDLTPEGLEKSAQIAEQRAQEWLFAATQLRAKAADLRGDHITPGGA